MQAANFKHVIQLVPDTGTEVQLTAAQQQSVIQTYQKRLSARNNTSQNGAHNYNNFYTAIILRYSVHTRTVPAAGVGDVPFTDLLLSGIVLQYSSLFETVVATDTLVNFYPLYSTYSAPTVQQKVVELLHMQWPKIQKKLDKTGSRIQPVTFQKPLSLASDNVYQLTAKTFLKPASGTAVYGFDAAGNKFTCFWIKNGTDHSAQCDEDATGHTLTHGFYLKPVGEQGAIQLNPIMVNAPELRRQFGGGLAAEVEAQVLNVTNYLTGLNYVVKMPKTGRLAVLRQQIFMAFAAENGLSLDNLELSYHNSANVVPLTFKITDFKARHKKRFGQLYVSYATANSNNQRVTQRAHGLVCVHKQQYEGAAAYTEAARTALRHSLQKSVVSLYNLPPLKESKECP